MKPVTLLFAGIAPELLLHTATETPENLCEMRGICNGIKVYDWVKEEFAHYVFVSFGAYDHCRKDSHKREIESSPWSVFVLRHE